MMNGIQVVLRWGFFDLCVNMNLRKTNTGLKVLVYLFCVRTRIVNGLDARSFVRVIEIDLDRIPSLKHEKK